MFKKPGLHHWHAGPSSAAAVGDTGIQLIGTRHGEKLYETLMTREERIRSEDMGEYYRVSADGRDLNYDKFVVEGRCRHRQTKVTPAIIPAD